LDRSGRREGRRATALQEPELATPAPSDAPPGEIVQTRTDDRGGRRIGRRERGGALPPRAPLFLARCLPHLLVLLIVGAVVVGKGFWDPALRGEGQFEAETTIDLSVPLNPAGTTGAPASPPEREAGSGSFTRPPLPITAVRLRITTYETRANETPAQVAGRFGLRASTLLWANGLQDPARPLLAGT
jgi:hypothetical protein